MPDLPLLLSFLSPERYTMSDIFEWFAGLVESCIDFLDSIPVIGSVSLLYWILGVLLVSIVVNVFVPRSGS